MKTYDILVSDLCEEIDYLKEQLKSAKIEAMHYKTEYNSLLSSSLNHSQKMMTNMLDVLLTEGVCEKFASKKEQQ